MSFVTREEIDELLRDMCNPDDFEEDCWSCTTPILVRKLLAERDAYREIAMGTAHVCTKPGCTHSEEVDAEALRILVAKMNNEMFDNFLEGAE